MKKETLRLCVKFHFDNPYPIQNIQVHFLLVTQIITA